MKTIQSYLQKISIKEKYTPFVFLVIAFIGFGLLANRLGYYQDDWPYIFYAFNKGIPSIAQELYYDGRPNSAWLYISMFNVLGFKPIMWHLTAIVFRWLTATLVWYLFRRIWPNHLRQVTFSIFIFIVHPFFLIQSYAVNSILYWAGYLFFAASLLIMARNATEPKYRIPLTILAVILEAMHLFTSEYFVGMVLIRPFILYWILRGHDLSLRQRATKVITHWIPYLIALGAYVIWRLFLYIPPPTGDRNSPEILFALLSNPLPTLSYLIRIALQDSIIIAFTSWYQTLVPELFAFRSIFSWFVIFASILAFIITFIHLKQLKENVNNNENWLVQPLTLGLLLLLLGMLPIWIIGQDIVTHKNQFAGSRYGIGSTLGAALIAAVIVERLIDNKKKIAVIAAGVALAVSMHLTNEKDFAYSWEKQERFAQQLIWRAPQIEPGTALVPDEEILGFMGGYSVAFSINTSYQPGDIQTPPYWYFPFYYTHPNVNDFLQGVPLEDRKLTMNFSGNSNKMLLLSFNPEMKRCLWILQPQDTNLRLISEDMRQLSAGSDINLIKQNDGIEPSLPESIYGKQNNQTWCYYFEKADLARQYKQWDEVVRLWEESQSIGERADNGFEYVPFIEGHGHQENWEQVKSLTKLAKRITEGLEPSLCTALDRLTASAPPSQERDETINNLKNDLQCENFQ
ncbi:MAG: hypothetical protein H7Y59_07605 [Anaerolineales bacterium]|nr:hypothetical protein [Anaerolineales bacterium]